MHFLNEEDSAIVITNNIFQMKRNDPDEPEQTIDYGISLGIPESQLDLFSNSSLRPIMAVKHSCY